MKRILACILSIVCLLSLFGCNAKTKTGTTETSASCSRHNWQKTDNLNEYTARDKCSVCGDTRIYTDPDSISDTGKETGFKMLRYDWDGRGMTRKTISDCHLGYAIIDCLSKLEETGSIDPKISDDVLGDDVRDLPVEHGTVWIDCGSVGLFRLDPEMSEICKVETHFGEGKVLKMTETLDEILRHAWYYHPNDYWSGKYEQGEITLRQIYKADSAVDQVIVDSIQIENSRHSDNNTITLKIRASESKTVSARLESYQSNDNLGSDESKRIDLIKGEETTVDFTFYGFNYSYFVTIMIDNTRIELTIDPQE